MNTLAFPLPLFQRLLRSFAEERDRTLLLQVGACQDGSGYTWLARAFRPASARQPVRPERPAFLVQLSTSPHGEPPIRWAPSPVRPPLAGQLYLGEGPWRGHIWGVVNDGGSTSPLHQVSLIGAGMRVLQCLGASAAAEAPTVAPALDLANGPWSRSIGALGGAAVWRRLVGLRVAIVGCGRSGSLVATTLGRLGVRWLALIDGDRIEAHNLAEMDGVTHMDVGRPKVEALADHLGTVAGSSAQSIIQVVAAMPHDAALAVAKTADVLICCADNDAPRLATAILATLYHKVLLDVGTGIQLRPAEASGPSALAGPPTRTMGADVRLILPGDGCLLCRGNLTQFSQAVEDLCNPRQAARLREWRQERAGSLRALNQMAAGLAVRMLEDLVAERIAASSWGNLEFAVDGRLAMQYPGFPGPGGAPGCLLCAKAGLGDEGLGG